MVIIMQVQGVDFFCLFVVVVYVIECLFDCGMLGCGYIYGNEIMCQQLVMWFFIEVGDVQCWVGLEGVVQVDCMDVVDEVVQMFQGIGIVQLGCMVIVVVEYGKMEFGVVMQGGIIVEMYGGYYWYFFVG